MGYDSTNYISAKNDVDEIIEFLKILDYKEVEDKILYFNKKHDYKYLLGIYLTIDDKDDEIIKVNGRTQIFASKYDLKFLNFTIKQLNKRFGGDFVTDSGKNTYFNYNLPDRTKAEAGCYSAYFDLHNTFTSAKMYLKVLNESDKFKEFPTDIIPKGDPRIIGFNLIFPYIVSIIEEYFRDIYVALLRYSDRKSIVFKNSRPYYEYLLDTSNKEILIEEAIARTRSFQNIDKIHAYFKELDPNLDIKGCLKKPYEGTDEKLIEIIDRIIEQRHEFVHNRTISIDYDYDKIQNDLNHIKIALERIFYYLVSEYGWSE